MKKLLPLLLLTIAFLVPQYAFAGTLSDGCSAYTCQAGYDYYWQDGTGNCYVEINDVETDCTGTPPVNKHKAFSCSNGCYFASDSKKDWVYDYDTEDLTYSDGNVGIGISSPVDELHIHAAGGETYSPWIRLTNDNVGDTLGDGARMGIRSDGDFEIQQFEAGKNILLVNANVGIGTDSPIYKLEVQSVGSGSGTAAFMSSASDVISSVAAEASGGIGIIVPAGVYAGVYGYSSTGNGGFFYSDENTAVHAKAMNGGTGVYSEVYGGGYGFYTNATKNYFAGRVCIGTDDFGTGSESLIINSLIAGTSNATEGITIGNDGWSMVKLGSSSTSNRWGGIVWTTQDLRIESKTNIDFMTGTTDRMTIASNGNVTMNYDLSVVDDLTVGDRLTVNNDITVSDDLTVGDRLTVNNGATIEGSSTTGSMMVFQNNSSNDGADILSMRGTDFESTAAGSYYIKFYDSDPSGAWGYNGGIRNQSESSVAYATSSDARLKTNIKDYTEGLETLMNIKAREFEWIEDGSESIGFIAQELQPLFPYAVVGLPDSDLREDYMMIDYGRVTPLLVSAIQEQQQLIDELGTRVTELEKK